MIVRALHFSEAFKAQEELGDKDRAVNGSGKKLTKLDGRL